VFIAGVFQQQSAYSIVTASGTTTLTFSEAPANTREIIIYSVASAVSGSNLNVDSMTGDGTDTTLTLSIAPINENNTQVFVDGVYQSKDNYSISGTTLTFSTAPPTGSAVEVMTMTQTDINVPVDGTITPAKIASGDFYFDTNTLYVDSTNNRVGIGTSSPDANLVVYETATSGTDHFAQRWRTQSGGVLSIACSDLSLANPTWQIRSGSSEPIAFNQASNERMRIDSSGKVGIGTSSPEYNLDVTAADNVTTTTALSVQNSARNYGLGLGAYTLTNRNIGGSATTVDYTFDIGRHAIFKTNNSERMRINSSGELLVGRTTATGGGSVSDDAQAYFNGGINRAGVPFADFNDVWVSLNGGIIEGRSGFGPSNAPSGAGNWFHVTAYTTFTGGTAVYVTQVCTTIVGRIFTRYNPAISASGSWTSWVEK